MGDHKNTYGGYDIDLEPGPVACASLPRREAGELWKRVKATLAPVWAFLPDRIRKIKGNGVEACCSL